MNRYFFVAPFYDLLKRISFGDALNNATINYMSELSEYKDFLIVGGGSGISLPQFNQDQNIQFIDSNASMIARAKRRKTSAAVQYHAKRFEAFDTTQKFDVICFPFFIDLYNQNEATSILDKAKSLLNDSGRLVVTDFYSIKKLSNWRQKLLLRTVIVFFNITTWHRHSKIFNIPNTIKASNFQCINLKEFANGMVFASLWKKAEH